MLVLATLIAVSNSEKQHNKACGLPEGLLCDHLQEACRSQQLRIRGPGVVQYCLHVQYVLFLLWQGKFDNNSTLAAVPNVTLQCAMYSVDCPKTRSSCSACALSLGACDQGKRNHHQ